MYASLLFWLALFLPGYVVVRHFWKDDLKSGLLGVIGLSYLATFGLFSPISILCYVLKAPLAVFTVACVVSVVAAMIEITRMGWWRETGRLIDGGVGIFLIVIAADMVMGARVGALTGGDAVVHLTRVRVLLDHGFNNNDPFVAAPYFFPIYHTNLLHAFYAACSQLTGIHHLSVWFASLPWAKLLIASGSYYMTWCVFERRWPAWVAAMFTVGFWAPVNFILYPNKLAPLWLIALMIGFTVQVFRSPCKWQSPLKLCIGSLVLGQVHSLYGVFAGIALGPVLGLLSMVHIVKRRPDRCCLAVCLVALMAALPFVVVSKVTATSASRSSVTLAHSKVLPAEPRASARAVPPRDVPVQWSGTRHRKTEPETPMPGGHSSGDEGTGWKTVKLRKGWGTPDWRSACLVVGVACALAGSRRKQAALLLAVAGVVAAIFYIPPLYTAAVSVLGKKWIVERMGIVLHLAYVGLVPASAAFFIERKVRFRWVRSILGVAVLLFGAAFATRKEPTTWPTYWSKARAPRAVRQSYLDTTRRVRAFCRKHIPRGVTVLLNEWPGMSLTMIHDCRIVAPQYGGNGIRDLDERRKDLKLMLANNTPWETRRALLRKYDIRYFFPAGSPTDWTRGHLQELRTEPGFRLFVIDTDH